MTEKSKKYVYDVFNTFQFIIVAFYSLECCIKSNNLYITLILFFLSSKLNYKTSGLNQNYKSEKTSAFIEKSNISDLAEYKMISSIPF